MGTLLRGGGRWLLPGPLILGLLVGVMVALPAGGSGEYVGFAGLALGLPTAAILIHRRSRSLQPRERKAWRFMSLGLGLFATGVIAIGLLTELGVNLPAFGLMDAFFLSAYLAIITALIRLTRLDSGGHEWVLTVIDALVGGIALATLVWHFVFHDLIEVMQGAHWWELAIAATYPVFDIVLIVGLLILIMRRSAYHLDARLAFFAVGAAFQVLADLAYLRRGVGVAFTDTEPAWALNLAACVFLVVTAAIVDRTPRRREFPEAPTPIWAIMWPYLLAAGLAAVHFDTYRRLEPGANEILLLDAVVAIGVIIFLRQIYAIYRDRNRVDQKRAELVASVSHELRTPLTAMVGFLTLLDENPDEFPVDAQREMISEAANQARHMSRLVSDLIMLARGDTRYMSMEVEAVRATSLVISVLRQIDAGHTKIEEDLDADAWVRVDPDRIKQALGNLITNAIRYGGDRCLVAARAEGRDLIFEVHDNGEGVPTRYESLIWEHFERGAHRLDSVTPGLGIGLSIVQAVMEAHGGRAEYRASERLGGACFSLVIPGCVVDESPVAARVVVGS